MRYLRILFGSLLMPILALAVPAGAMVRTQSQVQPAPPDGDYPTLGFVGHLGGTIDAMTVRDGYAYMGQGGDFVIYDMSPGGNQNRLGYVQLMVDDIVLAGDYAYVLW